MSLSQLIERLFQQGMELCLSGGQLRYHDPKGVLTPELKNELEHHKTAILSYLSRYNGKFMPFYPLSSAQKTLWLLYQLAPNSAAYNIKFGARVLSELDSTAFQRAFQALIDRHPSLRTTYTILDEEPVQLIHEHQQVSLQFIDASAWDPDYLYQQMFEKANRPFDLEQGPILRAYLFSRSSTEHILWLLVHHIAVDISSVEALIEELGHLYSSGKTGAPASLPPIELQYADYVRWEARMLASPEGEQHWTYWKKQLGGELPVLNLPTDRPRPPRQTYHTSSFFSPLGKDVTQQFTAMAQTENVSLYTTLIAAFLMLLYRYTHQEDILLGLSTSEKNHRNFPGVLGYFANQIPLRADLSENPTWREFLHKMHQAVQMAFEHQDYPSHLLTKQLYIGRDLSHSPLFQAIFMLQSLQRYRDLSSFLLGQEGGRIELDGLEMESMSLEEETMIFVDLQLTIVEGHGSLSALWQYNTDLFDAATIKRLAGNFHILLQAIIAHPEQHTLDLPLLKDSERHQLLLGWNDTGIDYPRDKSVYELFESQVERTPDATAVVFDDRHLTYRELNARANQLAYHLRALGVGPDVLVGICVERSLDMVVGLLGIMKAGGAYVPLDPAYPQDRLTLMLEDAQVLVLVTQQKLLLERFSSNREKVVCLDSDWETISQESQENPMRVVEPENLAYVIYTSGSTGKPKGVQISQRALVNFLVSMQSVPGLSTQDILLAVTTISFDIAALEMYLPLIVGAQIVLASREEAADGGLLLQKLLGSGATIMQATPVSWRLLMAAGWEGPPSLKVLCGGEAMSRELAEQLTARSTSVWNMYGPTETTIWSTLCKVQPGEDLISIGRPIANTEIYILDDQLQPVPIGVPGELLIGGDGLARGYLKRPELTNEKFIPHPFSDEPNARLYKTGDLARYLSDGALECLGRLDHQVKIRGFRIELGEIEAVLISHLEVREAVVVALEDAHADKRLVAYLVPAFTPDRVPYQSDCLMEVGQNKVKLRTEDISFDGVSLVGVLPTCSEGQHVRLQLLLPGHSEESWLNGEIVWCQGGQAGIRFKLSSSEQTVVQQSVEYLFEHQGFAKLLRRTVSTNLRNYLNQKLPDYMVPSSLIFLDSLPLTPNGKVDRRALPSPERTYLQLEEDFVAPRSVAEKMLAEIWMELLDLERVGIHDNFFELGGDSLKITRLASRLRTNFRVELSISKLFELPTITDLAKVLEKYLITTEEVQTIPRRKKTDPIPLSFVQQRLWFLEHLEGGHPTYNIPFGARLKGSLDVDLLKRSINEIIQRHEVLRTSFATVNGQPVVVIAPSFTLELPVKDFRGLLENEREIEVEQLARENAQQVFDLSQCPLFRITLIRIEKEEYIFFMTIHHIIFDGWSIDVFMEELTALYEAFSTGQSSPLSELPIQYTDFAQWQREWLQGEVLESQFSYWKEQLSGDLPVLELPTDRPRPTKQTFQGEIQSFALSKHLSDALKSLSRQEKVTPFMMLLAAFKTLLYRYTGQEDIIVGSPIANRNRAEIEKLIGFFVNTLVLRTDVSGNPTFRELLGRVRQMTLEAQAHQDMPFDQIVTEFHPERELNRQPLFQVMFASQDILMQKMGFSGIMLEPIDNHTGTAMFDLSLDIADTEQGLTGIFEYNIALFDAATISRMIGHFQTLLEGIVANPKQHLSELPILMETEWHQILKTWNDTTAEYLQDSCIHELFEAQVEKTPNAVAVVLEGKQMTYHELNQQANQLAHYLQKYGVGPEVLVAIYMERSLEMIVGLLGILKAGGAYLPMDFAAPQERLMFMLEDTQASVLLTQQYLRDKFPAHKTFTVCLDSDRDAIVQESRENPVSGVTAKNLVYIIYTSGSTGKPKGVMIQHRSLVNYTETASAAFMLQPDDRVLQFASISFDASAEEIFPCLTTGATLVLRTDSMLNSVSTFLGKCQEFRITVLDLPTAYWHQLTLALAAEGLRLPKQLRLVIIGGERAIPERLATWQQHVDSNVRLINTYGPTEATVVATMCEITQEHPIDEFLEIPIGYVVQNNQAYILDQHLNPVPINIPGELYIGGTGLARCYLHQPELTVEKFIIDPYSNEPGARLYKTGDLVRYLPDGNIEFLGRIDHQVKIRGFRIELGEIETTLRAHPAIREAVVVAREDVSRNKRLVAYIISGQGEEFAISELRDFLKKQLPEYMVPAIFTFLETLPLTPSGKVDRHALPDPDFDRPGFTATFVAPRNATEELLADIWAELLGFDQVGVHDNFFDLGGHSLLSMQLMSRISTAMSLDVSIKFLFLHPTIARLAVTLGKLLRANSVAKPIPVEVTTDIGPASSFEGNRKQKAPSLFKVDFEPLSNTAPFEAIALDYFLTPVLKETGLSRDEIVYDWCNNLPVLYNVTETNWGRIGVLMLPLFDFELYHNKEGLLSHIVEALEISEQLGASMVSLTGLLPSATNYGRDIAKVMADREDLPMITTGHDTTCATVVLTTREILQEGRRNLTQEQVGFLGLGSIGVSSLRLMLRCLPHPAEIILCDVYSKLGLLEKIQQELVDDLGFRGRVHIAPAQVEVPPEFYDATLVIGATNVPDILDIDKVRPGTMIVDDSGPHCFMPERAIKRFQEQRDILFTEGGVLRSPHPITDRVYLPPSIKKDVNPVQIMHWFSLKGSPFDVTSCIFSSLLSARFEGLAPTVGEVDSKAAFQHYEVLDLLGFRGSDLHCEDYVISEESIQNFRSRFGKS